ncbi:zinc ribbon domain-containing protein [Peribacillus asahii]|nr:transposase [Peribacillus asahii]
MRRKIIKNSEEKWLEYKAKWYRKQVIEADFHCTSQRCRNSPL